MNPWPSIRWQWYAFSELSGAEIYAILAARSRVFVVEQQCVYLDQDGLDLAALHLAAWSGADAAGYLRVVAPGVRFPERSIGRVITTPEFRGSGLGRELMQRGIARFPGEPLRISAQAYLEVFYTSLGFARVSSEPYLEDGIPHIEMYRSGRDFVDE